VEFEWDAAKELAKIRNHKVSFTEAVETFFDPNSFQMTDLKHSGHERRYYWVGESNHGRILTTWLPNVGQIFELSDLQNGDNFGGFTMKQPNLNDLVIDRIGTRTTRKRLKKARTIKITIHINQDTLVLLRKKSWQSRVPYQPLLNQVLIAGLRQKTQAESRLDRIEKELKRLKRRIAA
jgi:uncharacterized DUF497 family protein